MANQTLVTITKGKAAIVNDGLRCRAPRPDDPTLACNKCICKKNSAGYVAGNFKCERCGQLIEVEIAPRDY